MTASSTPLLTPAQRRIVGFALTFLALVGSAVLFIGSIAMLARTLAFFSSVLWPLAIAGVLALVLRPVVALIERRLHVRRVVAVIVLYGLFLIVMAALILLLGPPLVDQLIDFFTYLPTFWNNAVHYLEESYPRWMEVVHRHLSQPTIKRMVDAISEQGRALVVHALPSLRGAVGGLFGVFGFITHVAIIPVYLFFFLLMRGTPANNVGQHFPFLSPNLRDDISFLAREFVTIVESFFRGQLVIGLAMGVMLAAGFTLIGLKFGLFIGLALGVLNIVPYLGTIVGLGVALPLAFFQTDGGWKLVGLVLLVKIIVQCVESWVLTPRIMGHRTGLHPVAIIVAIFFWGHALNGVLGMILAVPLTAFFVTVWRLLRQKYLQRE